MAIRQDAIDDIDTWLDGLGKLKEALLEAGLKTKEELLWLSQTEIDNICAENEVPIFDKKRFEMKLLALQAITRGKSPTPNLERQSPNKYYRKESNQSQMSITSRGGGGHGHGHGHKRYDSNYSITTRGGDDEYNNDTNMNDMTRGHSIRSRQPTIVRIVFSEAEELKMNELEEKILIINDKREQIRQNMSSLNWEKDRLEKRIDKYFDEFVLHLQRRREDVKTQLNDVAAKQMKIMRDYVKSLDKQTGEIKDAQRKCEKYLSNPKLGKASRKNKVLKVANKALNNKTDEKIIVPEIQNKKKKSKDGKKKKESKKTYFVTMELDENQVKRYIESIGQIRRVLVPYPPKFEIFTIEATRIKLKVWDQHSSSNKLAKKEKTEFIAKIAEQNPRNLSLSEEYPDMPSNNNNDNNNNDNNHNDNNDNVGDELTMEIVEQHNNNVGGENGDNSPDQPNDDDNDNIITKDDDDNKETKTGQVDDIEEEQDVDIENEDDMNEEYKYDNNNNINNNDDNKTLSASMRARSSRHRESRHHDKKRRHHHKSRHNKKYVNWEQYPVFRPHDTNDRKVMSNKYTIWIDNLHPNTTYLLKLRGCNKYGHGDWTKIYSFVTKLTSFEFKSSVIKSAEVKNAMYDILCKKLNFGDLNENGLNSGMENEITPFRLQRIFSAASNNFSASRFHQVCDNKGPTLVIAESEYGSIFGGYSSVSWTNPKEDKFRSDKNAFLFLLRNDQKKNVSQIFDCNNNGINATVHNITMGPAFGQGIDLMIGDQCQKTANSYSNIKSYNVPKHVLLGGRKNFKIKNYDVYTVKI